jgi:Gluconate 2-dehydrogenase subunit 3
MADRYPGYDVLSKRWTESWNDPTRRAIDRRLAVSREPRFFSAIEWQTLEAVCDRIMPQPRDRPPVPLPAYVDQKMADGLLDGYRYAELPPQGDAWRRGLAALDQEARRPHSRPFHALPSDQQDVLLGQMQKGELTSEAWGDMPCKLFFEHRVIPDITHAYYAHPTAWNEIGFGGPASPRGYVRMGLDRRDPWEAVEVRRKNSDVD